MGWSMGPAVGAGNSRISKPDVRAIRTLLNQSQVRMELAAMLPSVENRGAKPSRCFIPRQAETGLFNAPHHTRQSDG